MNHVTLDSELDKHLVQEKEVGRDRQEVSWRWVEKAEEEETKEDTEEVIKILMRITMMDMELIDQILEATNLTRTVTATATIDRQVMQLPHHHQLITSNLPREHLSPDPMVILQLLLLRTTIPLLRLTKVEEL